MTRSRGSRPGRNSPCPCGSGRKFKHCHGQLNHPLSRPGFQDEMQRALERHEARERLREHQHGRGHPIVSFEFEGRRFIAVKNKLYHGKWTTLFDFLAYYVKNTFGEVWWKAEVSNPSANPHPIQNWAQALNLYQQRLGQVPGKVQSAAMSGATAAYFGLAYNLFLLDHNVEVQQQLVKRLKNPRQFYPAYYETFVAAWFILAGFELNLENENDPTESHCEFTAYAKESGNRYSVEAKSRQSGKTHLDVGTQLAAALKKSAAYTRIVLIDVNVPSEQAETEQQWIEGVSSKITGREAKLTVDGVPAPPAYVIVTNNPSHHDLEGVAFRRGLLAEGFKIPDFGSKPFTSLIAAFKARQKHADVYQLVGAIRDYRIPSTFDGEVPEFAFAEAERRWIIGNNYELPDIEGGVQGKLTDAIVLENEKRVYLVLQTSDNRSITVTDALSDAEIRAYRHHPDTFFGVYRHVSQGIDNPIDLFAWFHENYKDTPRERLLELVNSRADIRELAELPQDELVLKVCEGYCMAMLARTSGWNAGSIR
ncbi:MAG: YecA family protein [Gammaproteobacteria bacterium]